MAKPAEKIEDETKWAYKPSFVENAVVKLFKGINKHVEWHKLPTILGTFVSSNAKHRKVKLDLTSNRTS